MSSSIFDMTVADSWQAYKALLDGVAEWGGKTSNVGLTPDQPRTWIGHVQTLDENLPGKWQKYVQDSSIAAKDQLTFRNHVILALAAEKTRLLALGSVPIASISSSQQMNSMATPVVFSSMPSQQQAAVPRPAPVALGSQAPARPFSTVPQPQVAQGPSGRFESLLNEARDYRRAGKWSLAKDAYSQALAIQPGNPEAKEGLNYATQKAGARFVAIFMPIACAGMIAFILIFLNFALSW